MLFFFDYTFILKICSLWIFLLLCCIKYFQLQVNFSCFAFIPNKEQLLSQSRVVEILDTFPTHSVIIWKNNWTGAKTYISNYSNTSDHSYIALELTVCYLKYYLSWFSCWTGILCESPSRAMRKLKKTKVELHDIHRLAERKDRKVRIRLTTGLECKYGNS